MIPDLLIYTHSISKNIHSIFTTIYGWALIASTTLLTIIKPETFPLLVVLVAIFLDFIWGILAAIKQKKPILSTRIKESFKKVFIYGSALLTILLIERIIHEEWEIATKISCVLAAACEFWSMSANMLIFKPDMPFLKLFRLQLKGEIEKKTGINTDKILKDDTNE